MEDRWHPSFLGPLSTAVSPEQLASRSTWVLLQVGKNRLVMSPRPRLAPVNRNRKFNSIDLPLSLAVRCCIESSHHALVHQTLKLAFLT